MMAATCHSSYGIHFSAVAYGPRAIVTLLRTPRHVGDMAPCVLGPLRRVEGAGSSDEVGQGSTPPGEGFAQREGLARRFRRRLDAAGTIDILSV